MELSGLSWKHKLDLQDLWDLQANEETEMPLDEFGKKVATRVRGAAFYGAYHDQEELENICKRFESLDALAVNSHFNYILSNLYDWCDTNKRVWIATNF